MNKPPFLLPPPPEWLQAELRNRLILLLNHVLMQEPEAMERLRRQKGKTVLASWADLSFWLESTPAGLLAVAEPRAEPDLRLNVAQRSPFELLGTLLSGQKPPVDIQGDVQLAAEVAWLVDNVRWDIEEDLARLMGDAGAHTLANWARTVFSALKTFVGQAGQRAADVKARVDALKPQSPQAGKADQ